MVETILFRARQDEKELQIYMTVALLYLGCVLVSLLCFQLYFVDGVLSLIPFGYVVLCWYRGELPVFGSVLVILAALCALVRISVALTCPPWERRKK